MWSNLYWNSDIHCFLSYAGSLCLCGDQIEVAWLTPIIKQELHNVPGNLKALPSSWSHRSVLPQVSSRPIDCQMLPARASVLDYLKLQCELHQLGSPVIFTKCVQRNPEDWLQFWYQVVIPKYPSPFSGFIWIKPDPSGLEDHEKVKYFVALQLLKVLGKCAYGLIWEAIIVVVVIY